MTEAALTENEIGIEQARAILGDLANRAHYSGQVTYITRHGRRIAAIAPLNHIKEPAMTIRLVAGFGDHPDLWGSGDPQPGKIVVFVDRHIYTEGDPIPMVEDVASTIVEGDMAEIGTFDRADAALARLGYRRDDEWEPSSYGYAARCEAIASAGGPGAPRRRDPSRP